MKTWQNRSNRSVNGRSGFPWTVSTSIFCGAVFCAALLFSDPAHGRQTETEPAASGSTASADEVAQPDDFQPDLWTRPGIDWPDFLGPERNGVCTETGIVDAWKQNGLKLRWKVRAGEGYAIGSVANGRFFHFDRIEDQARLVCLNAESGEQLWEHRYPCDYTDLYDFDGGPRTSPVVDEQRVFIYGPGGMLKCISIGGETGADEKPIAPGTVVWEKDVSTDYGVIQNFFGVGSTPVVYKNLLLVMVGGSPDSESDTPRGRLDRVSANDSLLVAFDKRTGEEVYQTGNDLASYSSIRIAPWNGEDAAFVFARTSLFGFEPETGEQRFEFPWRARKFESVNASTPQVIGNRIFITESYGPGGAMLEPGEDDELKEVWSDRGKREQAMASHWCTPVIKDGFLYGCSGEKESTAALRCIDLETGEVQWSQSGNSRVSAVLIEDHLLVLGERGALMLVEASPEKFNAVATFDGSSLDPEVRFQRPCWSVPVVSHGLIFIRDKTSQYCFDPGE